MRVTTATAFTRVSSFARFCTGRSHLNTLLDPSTSQSAPRRGFPSLSSNKSRSARRCISTSSRALPAASTSQNHASGNSPTPDELKNQHGPLSHVKKLITTTTTLIFVSATTNPYHNLALENYLLTQSSHDTNILFLYTNSPCVVIGRNQNPWVECDLAAVRDGLPRHPTDTSSKEHAYDKDRIQVDLLRRRSGGGTVVHSPGNLNYCVIVPNDKAFKRRTHAEMVVRALRSLQADSSLIARFPDIAGQEVKVNERHDIVMRQTDGDDWLKVSGSAFKLKRGRALHHGTLLIASPYLSQISSLLRSPAKDLITTKGVDSVRSPVGNLFRGNYMDSQREKLTKLIQNGIIEEFRKAYGVDSITSTTELGDGQCEDPASPAYQDAQELDEDDWRFGQTPRFTFTLPHSEPGLPLVFTFEANRGLIETATIETYGETLDFHRSEPDKAPCAICRDGNSLTLPSQRLNAVACAEWADTFEWITDQMEEMVANDADEAAEPTSKAEEAEAGTKAKQNAEINQLDWFQLEELSTAMERYFPEFHHPSSRDDVHGPEDFYATWTGSRLVWGPNRDDR